MRDARTPLHHQTLEVLPAALRIVGDSMDRHLRPADRQSVEHLAEVYRAGAPLAESSPLDAPDHRRLAPALILAAEFDPLRDGATAYADALRRAGVPVRLRIGPGHDHASPVSPAAGRALGCGATWWSPSSPTPTARALPIADPALTTGTHR